MPSDGVGEGTKKVFVQPDQGRIVIKIGADSGSHSGNRFSTPLTDEESITLAIRILREVRKHKLPRY